MSGGGSSEDEEDKEGGSHKGKYLTEWNKNRKDWPSNCDVWWNYRNEDLEFDIDWVRKVHVGNTMAPRGHYKIDPFFIDRSDVSGIGHFPIIETRRRPSAIAFYAGRVWYAGVWKEKLSQTIYFSQVLNEGIQRANKCFQQQDPTKVDGADLLDNDGGTIVIPEVQQVIKLFVIDSDLFVFATNGIWVISGTSSREGRGSFKATDYTVTKFSSLGCLSAGSFVEAEGMPFWWNYDGIFTIGSTEQGAKVTSLTRDTIQTFFDDIPDESKKYAKGAYNQRTKIIQWVYRNDLASEFAENYRFDKILNLNLDTGAFYYWTPAAEPANPSIIGITAIEGPVGSDTEVQVVVEGVDVEFNLAPVVVTVFKPTGLFTKFKYPIYFTGLEATPSSSDFPDDL